MKKAILAIAAAATITVGTLSVPTTADARCHGCGIGAGIAAGVIGGAIIGGAIANSGPRYVEPVPVYGPPPPRVYYEDEGPVCHVERQRVWVEGYGYRTRRMEVCD